MTGKCAKKRREFSTRNRVDSGRGTVNPFERGEELVVLLGDGVTGGGAQDHVERLWLRVLGAACFEDDAHGIPRESVLELKGKQDREFDARRANRCFLKKKARWTHG